ncbi:MAG: hypothetical protein ACFB51_09285 [Anaerolineae bacterium]
MTAVRGWRPLHIALALFIMIAVLGPLPLLIGHRSPEPAVLGRYTRLYAFMLVCYGGFMLLWAAYAGLLAFRPTWAAAWGQAHPFWRVAIPLGLFLGTAAFRGLHLARILVFPTVIHRYLAGMLSAVLAAGILLTMLVLGAGAARHTTPASPAGKRGGAAVLLAGMAVMLLAVSTSGYWNGMLSSDSGLHLYLGQHVVLHSGTPYQDLIYFHPALRFGLSALWTLGARFFNADPVIFVRVLDLFVVCGVLAVTYRIGQRLTGAVLGGAASLILLVGTEHIQELLLQGPTFRLTTLLLALLGLWMAQERRWLASGALLSMATLLYIPAGVYGIALIITAVTLAENRGTALARVGMGIGVVLIPVGMGLLLVGSLQPFLAQVFGAVLSLIAPTGGGGSGGALDRLRLFGASYGWVMRYDWEVVVLALVGMVLAVNHDRRVVRPVLLAGVLMLLAAGLQFDGSVRDTVMVLAPLVPFGAAAAVRMVDQLAPAVQMPRTLTGAAVIAMVALISLPDWALQRKFLIDVELYTLAEQRQMAQNFFAEIGTDETTQHFNDLWLLALTEEENALPVVQTASLGLLANEQAGWTPPVTADALVESDAAVVVAGLGWLENDLADAADAHYIPLGLFDLYNGLRPPQAIYVRSDRTDLIAFFESWPLEE